MRITAVAAILLSAGVAAGQSLFAVTFQGSLYRINTATGAATLIGATGFDRLNAAAMDCSGAVYSARGRNPTLPADVNQLIQINPVTGVGTQVCNWGAANDIRGLAFGDGDTLFAIRDNSTADSLCTIDLRSGVVAEIGPTGRNDLAGLSAAPDGRLLAIGVLPPGAVYDIDPSTGMATLIGGSGPDNQTVEFAGGSMAWVALGNLATVNLNTGATTIVGSMGITEVRGLAGFRPACGGVVCYANCDGSTGSPVLTGNDFQCFLDAFASGLAAANCDGSTGAPLLTGNDFQCFLNAYAAGCP